MIDSGNQELFRHIHCFEYMFCHQNKTIKFCSFYKFLIYDPYLEFYSLNVSDIYYSTIHPYINYDLLMQQYFYSSFLLF